MAQFYVILINMKICQKCGNTGEFYKDKTRADGFAKWCKSCMNEYSSAYRKNNKEHIAELSRAYHQNNKETICARTRQWVKDNSEQKSKTDKDRYEKFKAEGRLHEYYGNIDHKQVRIRSKQWKKDNQGRVNAQLAKRRADIIQATPAWAEINEIIHIYNEARILTETTGIDHEVDHIVPLNSQLVCGLHCLANLQILTAEENNRKKCKLLTEQIDI